MSTMTGTWRLHRRGRARALRTWPLRDRLALAAGFAAPFLVALALVPFRTSVSHTNAALILVAVVVAVAALGSRTAGVVAALSAAAWFARGGAAFDTASSRGRTRRSTSPPPGTSRRRSCYWSSV
ncbi:hypothetical protein AB0N07_39105 [Streptomyces sp. NPDC051172]|uniref:hypothetical protein n=1 Tax=Streptomyces sp. NPDC051172 TaxID=3155796 RepID=UPI00343BE199